MYTGFNARKQRKQAKIEVLEAEIKRLQKLLGTMIHLHERLKNERSEGSKTQTLPSLPKGTNDDGKGDSEPHSLVSQKSSGEPTPRTNKEGA